MHLLASEYRKVCNNVSRNHLLFLKVALCYNPLTPNLTTPIIPRSSSVSLLGGGGIPFHIPIPVPCTIKFSFSGSLGTNDLNQNIHTSPDGHKVHVIKTDTISANLKNTATHMIGQLNNLNLISER